jgi:hypothetical protein
MDLQSGILLMGAIPISTTKMPLFTIKDDDLVFQFCMKRCHEDDTLQATPGALQADGVALSILRQYSTQPASLFWS